MTILCLGRKLSCAYYWLLRIDELHDTFHLRYFYLTLAAYQHTSKVPPLFLSSSGMLAMLILVLRESKQDQFYISQYIC